MRFILERDILLAPLQALSGIVDRRQGTPILGQVLIIADEASVTLCGTDMEVELRVLVDRPVEEPGETTLPGRKLLDICRSLPVGARIDIGLVGTLAGLRSGRSRFSLQTLPPSEFPTMHAFAPVQTLSVPGRLFRMLLEETQFAMAQQDVRYYLNGLLLELGSGRMRAVATDGHRLALKNLACDCKGESPMQVIVPRKAVAELCKMLAGVDDDVQLSVGTNHVQVHAGSSTLTSKLIDGRYPDYDRVLPTSTDKVVVADREALRSGLARSSILSQDRIKGVSLSLEPDLLRASAQNADREEAEEEIPVSYSGEPLMIGFNVSYLIDVLGAVKTDTVHLAFKDVSTGCVIQPAGEADALYVVMPMRV